MLFEASMENSYAMTISGMPSPSVSHAAQLIMCGRLVAMTCRCHPGFSNQTNSVMPLASVAIGILAYGESASPKRVAMLAVACLLVGLAAKH